MAIANSITFNGTRLDSLKVGFRTVSRPILPAKKTFEFSPSARDGSIDFSAANIDNRPHYEMRDIVIEIQIVNEVDLAATQAKLSQVVSYLVSDVGKYAALVFDDAPNITYMATLKDSNVGQYANRKDLVVTATLRCKPFPKSGSATQTLTGNATPLDFTMAVGSWYTKPKFTITGPFTKVTLKDFTSGRQLDYTGSSIAGDTTIIDFETESVTKNGTYQNAYLTGDFWELAPNSANTNKCTLTVTGGPATVRVDYDMIQLY